MALVVYDRVLQTGTANTTVSFSLSGTVTGYQSFAVVGDGNTTYYSATDGTNWETGLGTYASSGTVLTRTTVLQSSNSGSAVTFSGTVTVWIDYTASKSIYKDANGNITANSFTPGWTATATAAGTTNLTVASTYYQRFTGTSAQTVLLPSATTVALGQGFIIDNDSTGNITLQDNASGALGSIVSGMAAFIFCESNSTQAGSWSGYMFVPGSGPVGQVTWGTSGLSAGGGSITNATWAGSVISSTYLPTVTLGSTAVTLGTTVATFAGMTLNSPTFVTPVLGTPSSGTLTSCTGLPNAGLVNSSVTLGSTAVSLGTTVATFAGVTLSSPTFVTPVLGIPSSGTLSSCSGYNSNSLSGVTLASTVLVSSLTSFGTSPTFVTPILGTPTSGTLTNCSGYNSNSLSGVTLASTVVTSSLTSVGTIGTGTWSASFGAVSGANLTSLTGANVTGTVANATAAVTFSSTSQNSQFNSIGVGTAGSTTAGEIRATNNVTAYYSSDRTLKENIQDIPNALEIAVAIGSKTFDWTDAYLEAHGGVDGYFVQKSDFGVIAQDVQKVFPMAVRIREDGTLAVDYEKLGTLAFAALNQLLKRVEALEAK